MNDAISSSSVLGGTSTSPSAYYIGYAERLAALAQSDPDDHPVLWGRVTYLRFSIDQVAAFSVYAEDDPPETMGMADFLAILREWRSLVGHRSSP